MSIAACYTTAFGRLRDDRASLRGWFVTAEHELVILEKAFAPLFPCNIVPYLDFLRERNIRCNPCTFCAAIMSELQITLDDRSELLGIALSAAIEQIGEHYKSHIAVAPVAGEFTVGDVRRLIETHAVQARDLASNLFRYGNAMQAEASFCVKEQLVQLASPEIASQVGMCYEEYCRVEVGCERFAKYMYEVGVPLEQMGEQFSNHWEKYLSTVHDADALLQVAAQLGH